MSIIIGIDVGGSTTKIVGFDGETLLDPFYVKSSDPLASLYGAFGKFTDKNNITLSDVQKVFVTGAGSTFLGSSIYGLPTFPVAEFDATGRGGLYLSGLDEAIVVSMGTGTAIVHARADGQVRHLGGTGIGGGTLVGLSKKILGMSDVNQITALAEGGDLKNIDLRISDISSKDMPTLQGSATASNFGNLSDVASPADLALGMLNIIFETAGVLSVFGAKTEGLDKIVLTGNMSVVPQARKRFDLMEDMFGVKFIIPQNAAYATVIGAALSH